MGKRYNPHNVGWGESRHRTARALRFAARYPKAEHLGDRWWVHEKTGQRKRSPSKPGKHYTEVKG